jgi:hypothetical protein
MSTETPVSIESPRAAAAARRLQRQARGFRRSVIATVGILGLAATALAVAGAFRGPHLDDAAVAAETALERAGQRLVLQADQAIEPVAPADVRIEPGVPIEVTSDERAITIRFVGMLRALTEYRVTAAVTGASTGVTGTLEHTFTTPDLDIAVLVRDLEAADEVRVRAVAGDETTTLFAADRIQEFAQLRDGVAAVVLDEEGANGRLVIAPEDEQITQEVTLPGEGRLQQLRASDTTDRLGVVFTSADSGAADALLAQLLIFDRLDPSGILRPVTGLDGEPLSVIDWRFVPGTPYLVVQAFDQSMLLIDTTTADAEPVPLGEHAEMRGFLPGTLRLVVADPQSGGTIDLESGQTTPFVLPDDRLDEFSYPGKIVVLADDRYVEVVSRPAPGEGFVLDFEILHVSADGVEVIFDPDAGIPIRDICLSPNGQFLAVEVQDPEGEPDAYPNVSGRTLSSTYFVDLLTGQANRAIAGFASSWCA